MTHKYFVTTHYSFYLVTVLINITITVYCKPIGWKHDKQIQWSSGQGNVQFNAQEGLRFGHGENNNRQLNSHLNFYHNSNNNNENKYPQQNWQNSQYGNYNNQDNFNYQQNTNAHNGYYGDSSNYNGAGAAYQEQQYNYQQQNTNYWDHGNNWNQNNNGYNEQLNHQQNQQNFHWNAQFQFQSPSLPKQSFDNKSKLFKDCGHNCFWNIFTKSCQCSK